MAVAPRGHKRAAGRAMGTSLLGTSLLGLLALGLLAGCLAEPGEPTSSVRPGTTVAWSEVETLFQGTCAFCHLPGGAGGTRLDYSYLTTRDGTCVAPATALVKSRDRYASCLYLSVTGLGGRSMAVYLTAQGQELIGNWIDSGAPGPQE